MATNLTTRVIDGLAPRPKPYRVFDAGPVQGLNLQVSPGGVRNWNVSYMDDSKRRFHKLGRYPMMSRDLAREAAAKFMLDRVTGRVVTVEVTLKDMLEAYASQLEVNGCRPSTVSAVRRMFAAEIYPELGHRYAAALTSADFVPPLRAVVARGSRFAAGHLRGYLSSAYRWAARVEHSLDRNPGLLFNIRVNPIDLIPPIEKSQPGERYPTLQEMATTFHKADVRGGDSTIGALRFHLAMAGLRVEETIGARWDHLREDGGRIWLHIDRTKIGRPHAVPLPKLALEVVEEQRKLTGNREALFPMRHTSTKPIPYTTVATHLRYVRAKVPAAGVWSCREVRRAAKTFLIDAGVPRDAADRWHQHMNDGTVSSKHYNRSRGVEELIAVADAWDELLGGECRRISRLEDT